MKKQSLHSRSDNPQTHNPHELVRLFGATALAGSLGIAGIGIGAAGASTTPHGAKVTNGARCDRHPRVMLVAVGRVTTLGADTFTLEKSDGTLVTIDVNSSTSYKERGVASPTFGNIAVGDWVGVKGTNTASLTATTVYIATGHPVVIHHRVALIAVGKVTTTGTDTFIVKERNGQTVTVDVNSSTSYKEWGVASPTFGNIAVGDWVGVKGTNTTPLTATTVYIATGHPVVIHHHVRVRPAFARR